MQEIADKAQINKSMLHYYFRSKDQLFQKVFREGVKEIIPVIMKLLSSDKNFEQKVEELIDTYHTVFKKSPHLPKFVVYEMNHHPERFKEFMKDMDVPEAPKNFIRQIEEAVNNGDMLPVQPVEFVINIISLCVFPFIAKNMIEVVFGLEGDKFKKFVSRRKEHLPTFIFNAVKQ